MSLAQTASPQLAIAAPADPCFAAAPADPCFAAARIIMAAARSLSRERAMVVDHQACRDIAGRLRVAAGNPHAMRADILDASPYVIEHSGREKTLVEMVEAEEGDEAAKLRVARLLLRALDWQ